jgi:hypothetical protein
MAMGHAGEIGFHWAVKEGGVGGAVGAVLGAAAGWPHSATHALGSGGLHTTTWHNAFTSSADFGRVVEAGLAGGAAVAVGIAALVAAVAAVRTTKS